MGYPLSTAHGKQDPIYAFPDMKLRGLVLNFHIHVSVSDISKKEDASWLH
jgi:hypothetical protein